MTATNHMLAGAVMATAIQRPLLVVPLAMASHFVLDIFPHFGVNEHDQTIRNKHPLFVYILITDTALAITLLVLLPFVLHGSVNWLLVSGMLAAWIPDAVWIRHFPHHLRGTPVRPGRISRFHQRIQWFERPIGLVVELVWFSAMGVLLGYLAA